MFLCLILTFPSSTICTEEVTMFLNTQTLFWACSTSKPEGYRGMLLKRKNEKKKTKCLKKIENCLRFYHYAAKILKSNTNFM